MELHGRLDQIVLVLVAKGLVAGGSAICVVPGNQLIGLVEVNLALCDGRQRRLKERLEQLNIEQVGNEALMPAHAQKAAGNHDSIVALLLQLLPRDALLSLLIPVHPPREQALQLMEVGDVDLHSVQRENVDHG